MNVAAITAAAINHGLDAGRHSRCDGGVGDAGVSDIRVQKLLRKGLRRSGKDYGVAVAPQGHGLFYFEQKHAPLRGNRYANALLIFSYFRGFPRRR
jgi:hypothetical protein